ILEDHGIIRRFPWSAATLRILRRGDELKVGEYEFSRPMTPLEVFDKIERAGFGTAAEFGEAFRDTTLLRGLDDEAIDLEGYLFPDTYGVQKGTTPQAIVQRMVARFREVLGPEWVADVRARGLTVRQAVSMASL